jgi:hypothetical protein
VIDDAQNLIHDRRYECVKTFKQLAEVTGAKFILDSSMDMTPSLPIAIVRRSWLVQMESALA